jgi:hypothetical protein
VALARVLLDEYVHVEVPRRSEAVLDGDRRVVDAVEDGDRHVQRGGDVGEVAVRLPAAPEVDADRVVAVLDGLQTLVLSTCPGSLYPP